MGKKHPNILSMIDDDDDHRVFFDLTRVEWEKSRLYHAWLKLGEKVFPVVRQSYI